MKILPILFFAILSFAFVSCGDDFDCETLELNIGDSCDDGNAMTENDVVTAGCACAGTDIPVAVITYTTGISAIIDMSCAVGAPCHVAGTGTFPMTNYDEALEAVGFGRMIGAINHEAGFQPMPRNMPMLPQETIDQITEWINAGAPE